MTNDEWNASDDALDMLVSLKEALSAEAYASIQPTLHSYMLACCEKISHLLPQTEIQLGLDAARRYLMGDLDKNVLRWLDWYVEAECFMLDYSSDSDDARELVSRVKELASIPHDQAVSRLKRAAYFASSAITGNIPSQRRWSKHGPFLCPTLLKKFLPEPFDPDRLAKATPQPLMTNQEWTECRDILLMFANLRRLPAEKYRVLELRKTIHQYLLASCDKHMELLHGPMMQQALMAARQHLENPISYKKLHALWDYAFDEIDEHDSEAATEESMVQYQAQELALAAIQGRWPSYRVSGGSELCCPDLLRGFLPSPFDH
ncbi:MAG: hypothetical protein JKY60_05075 [Kordiimonadaceae bacterium]|nr:hypothetical protein [Kordiimonadaceae bacterium]